jgi:hypothetical protein
MPVTISGTNGVTFPDSSLQAAAASPYVLKNRIINGDMRIDQRNAGASVTPADQALTIDRWKSRLSQSSKFSVQQDAGAVTPPTGFNDYLGVTSLSAYSITSTDFFYQNQRIEGYNVADLAWGTANAKTVTLSFWVRSSLTGTFGGSVFNEAADRSYPFSYTISVANTWEQKTITIAGDTTGTWATTNGIGISLSFGLGVGSTYSGTAGSWAGTFYASATSATSVVGTNGATFYITGVQLEVGTSATPFERRLYNQELANCHRYYYRNKATGNNYLLSLGGQVFATTGCVAFIPFPVIMRTAPTALEQSGTAGDYKIINAAGSGVNCSAVPVFNNATVAQASVECTVTSGLVAGNSAICIATSANAYFGLSAEL